MKRDINFYRTKNFFLTAKATSVLCLSAAYYLTLSHATAAQYDDACLLAAIKKDSTNRQVEELKQLCLKEAEATHEEPPGSKTSASTLGGLSKRIEHERANQFDPYVITPHKLNYFLPIITTNTLNREEYNKADKFGGNLEEREAKFQLSFKIPLNQGSLFIEGDALYLGFTMQAWWQIYSNDISKPFRETNYQPEVFYLAPLEWHPLGGNTGFVFGIEHQSNGEQQSLSRSWNRVYGHFLFEKDQFAFSLRPWVRIHESSKAYPEDPDGDDNPDIEEYLGHFEVTTVYKWNQMEFSFTGRNNMATNKGAAELSVVFPLWGKLQGYATAFTGYGESLIDYDHKQTRFGIGISLNSFM